MPKEFFDRWLMPGDEQVTNVPSILDAYSALSRERLVHALIIITITQLKG